MESPAKVIAAFLGVFVAGAVFGGFFSLRMGARWMAQTAPAAAAPAAAAPIPTPAPGPVAVPAAANGASPAAASAAKPTAAAQRPPLLQVPQTWQAPQLMRRYAERLDLTLEQKERITPLFQRATEDYRRVQQNTFRETAIILMRLQQDIAKELTPEQREKLAQWEEKQKEALQRMENRQQKKGLPVGKPGRAIGAPATAKPEAAGEPAAPHANGSSSGSAGVTTPTPTPSPETSGD